MQQQLAEENNGVQHKANQREYAIAVHSEVVLTAKKFLAAAN